MKIDLLNIVTCVGISQGVFLVVFLLLKRGKILINLPLAIYVLLMSVNLLGTMLFNEGIIISLLGFSYITELCNLAYGLLIFLYTRNKIKGQMVIKRHDFWFLIPFVFYFFYYLLFYNDPIYDAAEYLNSGLEFSEHISEWIFETVVNAGFLIAALSLLRSYHRQIKQSYSALEKISFIATRNLIIICFVAYSFEALLIIGLIGGIPVADICYNIIYLLFILTLFAFGYNELIYSNSAATEIIVEEKYKKTNLKNEASKAIADNLRRYTQEQKPYLNPDITLKTLAELIGEQPYAVSQVINENFGQNYYEFINSYRIEEAKRILKKPEYKNYTLTAIGFEAGFNSKSAFYVAFKKHTGKTPSQF